jgi:hypothetical protein
MKYLTLIIWLSYFALSIYSIYINNPLILLKALIPALILTGTIVIYKILE